MLARLSSVVLGMTAGAALIMAWQLGLWRAGAPGPGLFPFGAALLLLGASLGAAVQAGAEPVEGNGGDRTRLFGYAGAVAAFGLALTTLGMVISTIGLILLSLRGIERRGWLTSIAYAVFIAASCWGLFKVLLGVPLPRGILGIG